MYGKIFESIFDSTLIEDQEATYVFMCMIILSDDEGVLNVTANSLARRINKDIETVERSIGKLLMIDEQSQSKALGGRRIINLADDRDWGWMVVNKAKYKKIASREEKRREDCERMARKRRTPEVSENRIEDDKKTNDSESVAKCRKVSQGVAACSASFATRSSPSDIDPKNDAKLGFDPILGNIGRDKKTNDSDSVAKCRKVSQKVANVAYTDTYTDTYKTKPMIKISFDRFWEYYPKKVGKMKAWKSWTKIKADEKLQSIIWKALENYKRTEAWQKDGGQFIPHPATWLNGRRWEDEIEPSNMIKVFLTELENGGSRG